MSRANRRAIKKRHAKFAVTLSLPEYESKIEADSNLIASLLNFPMGGDAVGVTTCLVESEAVSQVYAPKDAVMKLIKGFAAEHCSEKQRESFITEAEKSRFIIFRF